MTQPAARTPVPLALNVEGVTGQHERLLEEGWALCSVDPGAFATPAAASIASAWKPIAGPGPVAAVDPGQDPAFLDARDHWFRCRFAAPGPGDGRSLLCFDGLATLAEGWLNGLPLLRSDNMFVSQALDVTDVLREDNELLLRFAALAPELRTRRGRGRWPTRLVTERHLRSFRTTLLGYTPGFWPEVKTVGPWRPVQLVRQLGVALETARVSPRLDGDTGRLAVCVICRVPGDQVPARPRIEVEGHAAALAIEPMGGGRFALQGELRLPGIEPWWPHTHGLPRLHDARVELAIGGDPVAIELGKLGFRALELEGGDLDRFRLRINGEPIFCRGACWTPLDTSRLHGREEDYLQVLDRVRSAGMNMLRVGGTMVYESDAFYRLCDELGIMVWQDLMFANMDYPADDAFRASARAEAEQLLERTASRCAMTVLCGSSELQQQAAMMGRTRDEWAHPLFDEDFPAVRDRLRPELVYVPSTPCRGDLPMHVSSGPSHYYGVGAYRRPLTDATLAGVRFASECLAFANMPDRDVGDREGVPFDRGASWDFADITDHYLEAGFGVQVAELDGQRHATLSRVTTGELMAGTLAQWRRRESPCGGALVWWLKDIVPGAGWGVLDADGRPKACWHYLKRICRPRALWLVDQGLDGLTACLDNELPEPLEGELEVALYHARGHVTDRAVAHVTLGPREQGSWNVEGLLGHFVDPAYSYRFGPPETQIVVVRFSADDGEMLQAFHTPGGWAAAGTGDPGLRAEAVPAGEGRYRVTAVSERFAQAVAVHVDGFALSDSHFHLAPGMPHVFELVAPAGATPPRGSLRPLNAERSVPIEVRPHPAAETTP